LENKNKKKTLHPTSGLVSFTQQEQMQVRPCYICSAPIMYA